MSPSAAAYLNFEAARADAARAVSHRVLAECRRVAPGLDWTVDVPSRLPVLLHGLTKDAHVAVVVRYDGARYRVELYGEDRYGSESTDLAPALRGQAERMAAEPLGWWSGRAVLDAMEAADDAR